MAAEDAKQEGGGMMGNKKDKKSYESSTWILDQIDLDVKKYAHRVALIRKFFPFLFNSNSVFSNARLRQWLMGYESNLCIQFEFYLQVWEEKYYPQAWEDEVLGF